VITAVTTYFKEKIFAICLKAVSLAFVVFLEQTAIIAINRIDLLVFVINTYIYSVKDIINN